MKSIPLTKGQYALVDDQDYAAISQYNWCLITPGGPNGRRYAARFDKDNHVIYMHRVIMQDQFTPEQNFCDHRDGNGLNNTRQNLRVCNRSQNQRNRGQQSRIGRTSAFKGVSRRKNGWLTRINTQPGVQTHIGIFGTEMDAAMAYDAAALVYHGEFAKLNFPQGTGSVAA